MAFVSLGEFGGSLLGLLPFTSEISEYFTDFQRNHLNKVNNYFRFIYYNPKVK